MSRFEKGDRVRYIGGTNFTSLKVGDIGRVVDVLKYACAVAWPNSPIEWIHHVSQLELIESEDENETRR